MISGIKKSRIYESGFLLLILILFAGLVLRIFLSRFWTYQPDFSTWIYWANGLHKAGFSSFYDEYWCDYMPGYLYVLSFLRHIHAQFQEVPVEILFKLPANLSDFGISILIFCALKGITTPRIAVVSSAVYFFNPASLSNSVFWGQVDSVHTLPILLSIFLVMEGKFIISGIFASLAFMIKPQSFVIFPVLMVVAARPVFKEPKFPKLVALLPAFKTLVALIITMFVLTIPFIVEKIDGFSDILIEPISLIRERFDVAYSQYEYASLNAFNFWGMVAMWKRDEIEFMNIALQTWGTIIFAIVYAPVVGLLLRFAVTRRQSEFKELNFSIYYGVTLVLFGLFLFITRAHERHLLPTIVFLTIIAFIRWEYWLFYGVISISYVLNMFYSYLELTHRVESIPPGTFQVIVARLIPGIVILVLLAFVFLSVNFWRCMCVPSYLKRGLSEKGG